MERAFLEEFGLEKEQIDKILNQASKDIGAKVSEIAALQSKYDQKVEELKTANGTIDSLKKANTDNETLLNTISEYKEKVKVQEQQFHDTLIKNTAVMELQRTGAINPDLAIHLLDLSLGSVDKDGKVLGITEQVEKLAADESQRYLFNTPEVTQPTQPEQPQQNQPQLNAFDPMTPPPVDRGGYSPQSGEVDNTVGGWGARAGADMANGNSNPSTDDFWANFGTV